MYFLMFICATISESDLLPTAVMASEKLVVRIS